MYVKLHLIMSSTKNSNTLLPVGFDLEGNDYIGKSCLRYNVRALRVDCLKGTTLDL